MNLRVFDGLMRPATATQNALGERFGLGRQLSPFLILDNLQWIVELVKSARDRRASN